jgi:perosamine synthetase
VIPLTDPGLGDDEVVAAARVLRSGRLVQGAEVARLEVALAERCGRRHAVAVSNGTVALELLLRALGVGPGDEVLVPDLTWPSPAHAVLAVGARPVLVDVDPRSWNLTAEGCLRALAARAETARTEAACAASERDATASARDAGGERGGLRAVIAIDQFGMPAEVRAIVAAVEAAAPGVVVVEDAACAIGSVRADGTPAGSAPSVGATLSFHPRKVLTTGEGGAVLVDDDALAERLRVLRNHGQRAPGEFTAASTNARLSEVQAAVGNAQLARLDALLAARRENAAAIRDGLSAALGQGTLVFQRSSAPDGPDGAQPNEQTLGALLPPGTGPAARDRFIARCRERGVEVGRLSYALHRLPSLARFAPDGDAALPVASDIVDRGVALPLYATMTPAERQTVVAVVAETLREVLRTDESDAGER